ncbi:hypothetical protein HPB51_028315 [Rhipicephalus microplus]|uniref:Uncharacterized protein n=1 Tax=Rhipicephalus microplus TaxID=6941 RepID=A0A9J6CXU9_RHIMP|nr:hypothetical protein HPB51_028315 [Rhipicephalus microplus]
MESVAPETEQQVSPSVFAERGDARALVDCAEDDRYRPVCTSSKDQVCQISNGLPYCNRLLFDIGLELREQRGGSLSLVTIDVNLEPLPGPESCRATPFLRWLLQNHVCITAFDLWNSPSKPHGEIVLQELPENYRIKNLTLQIMEEDGSAHTHVAKHLPRLSSLETLSCSGGQLGIMGGLLVVAMSHARVLLGVSEQLPYSLWHQNNWISFFEMLPRNKHLKKFDVTHRFPQDYRTLLPVLEALARTKQSANVSFGPYVHGTGVNFFQFSVFSSIGLTGDESVQVDALRQLPAFEYFTSLSVDVFDGEELLFSALAKYIRETSVLQKLRLTVTSPQDPEKTATSMCWALLFASMAANTSISDLDILTNGSFRHNDCLTRIIRYSSYISRVSFQENTGLGNATKFVSLLSEAIGDNYVLLEVDLHGAKVGVDAKWCFFAIRETTRRNCGLVERAAAFNQTAPLDWHTACALEKVAGTPALVRELARKAGVAAAEAAGSLRSRLESVEGLHDFMRLAGVVRDRVACSPPAEGCGTRLHDLSDTCWRLVRSYLSFDDVKRLA